jgi:hypothetical protein
MRTRVRLQLSSVDDDAERIERATARLRAELLELDVEDVLLVPGGPPPPGSRGVDLAEVGNLLITLAGVPEALRQLVATVRAWLGSSPGYAAELVIDGDRITVTGISRSTQDRLVEAWLQAHGLDQAHRE